MRVYGNRTGSVLELERRLADVDAGLRWGGPQVDNAINGQVHLMDGLEQLRALEAAGLKVPEFTIDPEEALDVNPGTTVLARKTDHTQGLDIIPVGVCTALRRNWRHSDYYVKYISDVAREWRFHIFKGRSIARGLKHFIDGSILPTTNQPAGLIIRSRRLGWHLRHDIDPPKGLRTIAKDAVTSIGYELGAVDILELVDGSFVVLEIHSRPALGDEYTLDAYREAFRSL